MITISTRVEEETKVNAEKIADSIGLTLSAVINVFLKRFVMENGFPFDLRSVPASSGKSIADMTTEEIVQRVKLSVRNASADPRPSTVTYLDPDSKNLIVREITDHN